MERRYSEEYYKEKIGAMNAARRLIGIADFNPQTPVENEQAEQERFALRKVVEWWGKDEVLLALEKKRQVFLANLKHACQIGADGIEASTEEDLQRITAAKRLLASL